MGENTSDNLNNGLRIDKGYWYSDDFWLRPPGNTVSALHVNTRLGSGIIATNVSYSDEIMPAFELDLTSVVFASAAESSDRLRAGYITDSDPLTLRMNGSDKKIGTVSYDTETGKIVAQKDADATRTVSLVVQMGGATRDGYYSVPVETDTVVTKEQIQSTLGVSGIDLAKCKIWLETKEDNVTYAKMAEAKKINIVNSVELTGVKPESGKAFPATASCNTEGIDAALTINTEMSRITVPKVKNWKL